VEGINSGAADLDKDGKISVLELHNYAANKVQEAVPNMTPKLITLKDKGFGIILAKTEASIPKQKTHIEKSTFDDREIEYYKKQLEQQKEQQKEIKRRRNLHRSNSLKARFSRLSQLLKLQKWKEADEETWYLMFEAVDSENEVFSSVQSFKDFPCNIISEVNSLWLKQSSGHFGFSVQKQIREETKKYGYKQQEVFSQKLSLSSVLLGAGSDHKLGTENCPRGYFPRKGKSNQYDGIGIIGWVFDWQNDFRIENFEMMYSRLGDCETVGYDI
jgi:GUN4-like